MVYIFTLTLQQTYYPDMAHVDKAPQLQFASEIYNPLGIFSVEYRSLKRHTNKKLTHVQLKPLAENIQYL